MILSVSNEQLGRGSILFSPELQKYYVVTEVKGFYDYIFVKPCKDKFINPDTIPELEVCTEVLLEKTKVDSTDVYQYALDKKHNGYKVFYFCKVNIHKPKTKDSDFSADMVMENDYS